MTDAAISIHHLVKNYKTDGGEVEVLKDIDLTIKKGEFVAIMGPSGSGKSTLMHIIGALDVPTSGQYLLDGDEVGKLSDDELSEIRNKKIGFVFQAFNLLPRTTVFDNVVLPAVYGEVSFEERKKRALEAIAAVNLTDRIHHYSNQLSGGQQQRVAVARSLIMNPAIILADEPTGNLPTDQTAEIMQLFTNLHRQGHTIVIITHEPEVAAFAQKVFHLRDGRIHSIEENKAKILAAAHDEVKTMTHTIKTNRVSKKKK
jgi:putative ABC transport system ATP-binding protein